MGRLELVVDASGSCIPKASCTGPAFARPAHPPPNMINLGRPCYWGKAAFRKIRVLMSYSVGSPRMNGLDVRPGDLVPRGNSGWTAFPPCRETCVLLKHWPGMVETPATTTAPLSKEGGAFNSPSRNPNSLECR